MDRMEVDEYYFGIAKSVSLRSTCLRRKYGAIIVKNDEIIATGYNGAPRGELNCCDKGKCRRTEMELSEGHGYEECCAVHAEMNAIISASRRDMMSGTIYLYGFDVDKGKDIKRPKPCPICEKLIKNAGLSVAKRAWDHEIEGDI